ncbi:MAG: NAD(P)H-binding protein [Actinomycetota bacterium]|nr:NAD(P)H-binding protein [Actinomycetota bacterium]
MILFTGTTNNVGRHVISQILDTGAAVRGFVRNLHSAGLPGDIDVVHEDLSIPDTLDACLDGVEPVFLVWSVFAADAVPAFVDAVAKHVRRIVYLASESVGDDLEQHTDSSTARISAKLAA